MPTLRQRFAFQQLEVYQVAKAVAQLTIDQRRLWANVGGGMPERLATAMTNLLTEIAAGAAQVQRGDQRRYFQAARSYCSEAMSCIEVAHLHAVLPSELRASLTIQLTRVDAMLNGMIRRRAS
ncbi:MAG TPA: four helix bundle protein [Polyangia bacterium]|jgi:four helix bundle protein|nr:four helix bundle protein [Polyangia bacterium]